MSEQALAGAARDRRLHGCEAFLRVGCELVPFGFPKISEGAAGWIWAVHGKGAAQLDNNGEVVGVAGGGGRPVGVYCNVGGGNGEVRGGGVSGGGQAGVHIGVEEDQIRIQQCLMDGFSSAGSRGVGGGGEPRGVVGVEVTQDESIILGLEELVELRSEAGWTGGGGRDVDIEDI